MTVSNSTVRWGIISTAGIAERAFVPAVRQTKRGELVAVASRSCDKAASFADKHGIPQAFDDYTSLLASDEIEAVYNPLPNTMHREWPEMAAEISDELRGSTPSTAISVEKRPVFKVVHEAAST